MKLLVFTLLFVAFSSCGSGNNYRSRDEIRSLLLTRTSFGLVTPSNVPSTESEIVSVLGMPDDRGVQGAAEWYRYKDKEGGFIEIQFLVQTPPGTYAVMSFGEPSTY